MGFSYAGIVAKLYRTAETRWEIATKGLTGACTALINALKGALSQEKFDEFQVGFDLRLERAQKNWQTPSG